MEKVNEQQGMSEKMMDSERAAFESYRDKRNALLEGEGHAPRSKWRVSNAHYPTWEAAIAYARASLPAGVPDGWKLVPVEPTLEMAMAAKQELDKSPVYWCRYKAALRAAFEAAPTVKAEQVDDGVEFGFDDRSVRVSQEAYAIFLDRESALRQGIQSLQDQLREILAQAPSLPAAGSAVEEPTSAMIQAACAAFRMDVSPMRAMQAALRAALSAQQSAPERVSVPVELLERALGGSSRSQFARSELRALLASNAKAGKANP